MTASVVKDTNESEASSAFSANVKKTPIVTGKKRLDISENIVSIRRAPKYAIKRIGKEGYRQKILK